jgi:Ulp1 family protease
MMQTESIQEYFKSDEKLNVLGFEIGIMNALNSLNDRTYLNDEVINFLMNIMEKAVAQNDPDNEKFLVMNTFLYPQLVRPD